TLLALTGSVVVTGAVLALLGANPIDAYSLMLSTALATQYGIGQTLLVTTPLILTGLAAAIPFSARLWNVGAEGQLYAGAVVSVALGLTLQLPAWLVIVLAVAGGVIAGALYGLIPGILKALLGVNEVIVTFMLNFLGILAALAAIDIYKGPGVQEGTR